MLDIGYLVMRHLSGPDAACIFTWGLTFPSSTVTGSASDSVLASKAIKPMPRLYGPGFLLNRSLHPQVRAMILPLELLRQRLAFFVGSELKEHILVPGDSSSYFCNPREEINLITKQGRLGEGGKGEREGEKNKREGEGGGEKGEGGALLSHTVYFFLTPGAS